jgi:hypothetical protein
MRANKPSKNGKPTEPQSKTQAKNPTIPELAVAVAAMGRVAKTRSMTRSSRKSKIGRPTRGSSD